MLHFPSLISIWVIWAACFIIGCYSIFTGKWLKGEQNCICDSTLEVGCWASRDIRSGLILWEEKKLTEKTGSPGLSDRHQWGTGLREAWTQLRGTIYQSVNKYSFQKNLTCLNVMAFQNISSVNQVKRRQFITACLYSLTSGTIDFILNSIYPHHDLCEKVCHTSTNLIEPSSSWLIWCWGVQCDISSCLQSQALSQANSPTLQGNSNYLDKVHMQCKVKKDFALSLG